MPNLNQRRPEKREAKTRENAFAEIVDVPRWRLIVRLVIDIVCVLGAAVGLFEFTRSLLW